MLLKIEV